MPFNVYDKTFHFFKYRVYTVVIAEAFYDQEIPDRCKNLLPTKKSD